MNTAVPAFDVFAPGALPMLVLFGSRVSGLMLIAPVFSARPIPAKVRACILIVLVVMMMPVISAGSAPAQATPATVLSEALIGFTIGLGAALLVGAAEMAGELLAIQIGLQGSAIVDPMSHQQSTALGQFLNLFAVALLLSLNAHVVMLEALRASVEMIPIGASTHLREGLGGMLKLASTLFILGLRFAAPVIAVVLLVNVALAVLSRAAPQLNILSLAFPIQILAGLGALIALVPLLGTWFLGWESTYSDLIGSGLSAFKGSR